MPLYEFVCRSCRHPFEELVRAGETPACPRCAGVELEKQFSVFASKSTGDVRPTRAAGYDSPEVARACGSCGDPRGPGACASD